MKENSIKKMKNIGVAIILLLSMLTIMATVPKVPAEIVAGDDYYGKPATNVEMIFMNFTGTGNVNNSGSIAAVNGTNVWGTIRFAWTDTNATYYKLRMDNAGNTSAGFVNVSNNTYYDWDTTNLTEGQHFVNVTAYGMGYLEGVPGVEGADAWRDMNGGRIGFYVSNQMQGTPGIDLFQGGNHTVGMRVLTTNLNKFTVDDESTTIKMVDTSTAGWWTNSSYYLYYPVYLGGREGTYDKSWRRYNDVEIQPNVDYTVTFNRSGIWIIDFDGGLADATVSDADFNTSGSLNNTVPAWFWVNTSSNYNYYVYDGGTTTAISQFDYNSTGYLTLKVTDEQDNQPTASGYLDPVVDIRRDDNGSSIYLQNRRLDQAWSYNSYYKNNSYDGDVFPGDVGFWSVGNYTAYCYIDTDGWVDGSSTGYQSYNKYTMDTESPGWRHYNDTYGSGVSKNNSASWLWSAEPRYNWRLCGPWDPPEHNASLQYIRVLTGTPYTAVTENETVYYGFDGTINITLTTTSGGSAVNLSKINVSILDDDNVNVTDKFAIYDSSEGDGAGALRDFRNNSQDCGGRITVYETGGKGGWILINMTKWGRNATGSDNPFADNGTWDVQIWADLQDGQRELNGEDKQWTEEWNTSVSFRVSAAPSAQWKWVDDDGTVWDDANTDEIIPYIPNASQVPLSVKFKVYDSGGNTFGDLTSGLSSGLCESITQCAANITVSGNSLFTGTINTWPGFYGAASPWYANGIWTIPIIPTMSVGGGSVKISINAYNATVSKTISIGGDNYHLNGSVVTVDPSMFNIDVENRTLDISAKFSDDGEDVRTATVTVYYIDDTATGSIDALCAPIVGHDVAWSTIYSGGYYSIPINTTQQTYNQTTGINDVDGAGFAEISAPRNMTVYVDGPGNRDGYALVEMKPENDLEVHISQETFMAGKEYDGVTLSCDFVGENDTGTPSDRLADKNNFHMKIYDEWGNDVTGTAKALTDDDGRLYGIYDTVLTGTDAYSFEFDGVYGLDAGTYTVYAFNNTHNSKDNNATFEIKAVDVTCDMAPFIWMSDTNISATCTITYEGEAVNGFLVIDNMTDEGNYNRTWRNCSFNGNSDDNTLNDSLEISDTLITDGVVTVHDITANSLTQNESYEYITFWFKPSDPSGSQYARASEKIKVEVPAITPDPLYIPLEKTTTVYCTATGRGNTLSDVFVRLHGQGFDQNATTDIDGRVAFSINPSSTGNISIDVGEEGRTLEDTVVYVVAWVIDGSTDVPEVNELEDFTVTAVKEGTTEAVVGATVTIVGIGEGVTDANGEATFTSKEVTSDRTYTIKITAEGYAPDPDGVTITVINIPKLTLVLPDDIKTGQTVDVVVADDTGSGIVGAIITFNEKTYVSGVNGIAKIKTPSAAGSYTIKVTYGNYEPFELEFEIKKSGDIPGFELLAMIAALGVALILFRRRRH